MIQSYTCMFIQKSIISCKQNFAFHLDVHIFFQFQSIILQILLNLNILVVFMTQEKVKDGDKNSLCYHVGSEEIHMLQNIEYHYKHGFQPT